MASVFRLMQAAALFTHKKRSLLNDAYQNGGCLKIIKFHHNHKKTLLLRDLSMTAP